MRRIFRKHILAGLAVLALALNGCTDDELFHLQSRVEEGIPTQVTLPFQVSKSPVLTRAAIASEYEFKVENLYIFVFDENGNRVWTKDGRDGNNKAFFDANNGLEGVTEGNETDPTTGTVNFWVGSLNNARIIGIANLHTNTTSTAYSVTEAEMNAINSLAELQETVLPLVNPSVERGSLFLMTGNVETTGADGKPTTSITIEGKEGGSTTLKDCMLRLSRTDAKIEVQVTSKASNDQWKNFSFEPTTWQVLCVPQQTLLLPYEKDGCEGPWDDTEGKAWDAGRVGDYACQFFDEPLRPFEEMDRGEQDNTPYYTGGSFVFYMPENRTRYKQEITEAYSTTAYALRDEKKHDKPQENFDPAKPGQQYENKDFMYANDNATYLLLNGHLSYTDAQNYQVDADVTFTIHLGYVSKNANDYDTKRNGHYIYKVTVKGVNDIVVEVSKPEEDGEVRPGYEGNVVYSNQQVYELDSHYDRCLLEISPDKVTDQLMWGVKTPFSAGIHSGDSQDYSGVEDYRWIKFAINKLHNAGHDTYVKYPGDGAYNSTTANPTGLLDIDQLVTYLKKMKEEDSLSELIPSGSDHICITAFVDEYLYTEDPTKPGTTDLSLWKESVDREDRQMYLIVPFEGDDQLGLGDIVYSPDGASSVVNSLYTFTQKSIRTVFDVNNQSLRTAWGLESVMETGRLPVGDIPSEADNTRNGRANMLEWATGKGWEDVIKTNERYGLNSGYDNAAYACLLRNRDLNGDGTIDDDEIRWYLAAIDQLTDIYLGEYALDEQSQLYPRNKADRPGGNSVYWHYTSSSYNANDNAPWVLWAEEGASRGSYNGTGGSLDVNGTNYAYRCIRNLGIPLGKPDEEPDDLVPDVTANADGTYTIDMSRMNPKARRTNRETSPLPRHNEQSAQNRPYAAFVVSAAVSPTPAYERRYGWGSGYYFQFTNALPWINYQTTNPCPVGYRVPNQRELLIMATRLPENAWPIYTVPAEGGLFGAPSVSGKPAYMSQTSFSMNGNAPYSSLREGFMWNSSNGVFMLQNNRDERGYVRCVRDIDP